LLLDHCRRAMNTILSLPSTIVMWCAVAIGNTFS
jgi:hypothetical protein